MHVFWALMPLSPQQNVRSETDIPQLALRMRESQGLYEQKGMFASPPYSICSGESTVRHART